MSNPAVTPIGPASLPTLPTPDSAIPSNAIAHGMQPETIGPGPASAQSQLDASLDARMSSHEQVSVAATGAGPYAIRDGHRIELTRYQQDGKVHVDGDVVTQDIGRGKTAEYSVSQLAAHSKVPEYFQNTLRYAAKHGDVVGIDVHHGAARVTDPTLEARLPQEFPYRDVVMAAAVRHDLDPRILGAVGMQESGMGKGHNYDPVTKLGADQHGHGMWQMDDRYYSMADCERAGRDPVFAADRAAQTLSGNIKSLGEATGIQRYNGGDPALPYYHLITRQSAAIEAEVSRETSKEIGR